jgi:hypothetical protein
VKPPFETARRVEPQYLCEPFGPHIGSQDLTDHTTGSTSRGDTDQRRLRAERAAGVRPTVFCRFIADGDGDGDGDGAEQAADRSRKDPGGSLPQESLGVSDRGLGHREVGAGPPAASGLEERGVRGFVVIVGT